MFWFKSGFCLKSCFSKNQWKNRFIHYIYHIWAVESTKDICCCSEKVRSHHRIFGKGKDLSHVVLCCPEGQINSEEQKEPRWQIQSREKRQTKRMWCWIKENTEFEKIELQKLMNKSSYFSVPQRSKYECPSEYCYNIFPVEKLIYSVITRHKSTICL